MNIHSKIYNDDSFQKGFGLIGLYSNEKKKLAKRVGDLISAQAAKRQSLHILDVGGGDGVLWELLAGALTKDHSVKALLESGNFTVSLIDSSENQVAKAKERSKHLSWLHPHAENADTYLTSGKEFDLVLSIHMLSGFSHEVQSGIFRKLINTVKKNGRLFFAQPSPSNPLTKIKTSLRKRILNQIYTPIYLTSTDIQQYGSYNLETITSSLEIPEADLPYLSHFLLGINNPSDAIIRESVEYLRTTMRRNNQGFVTTLSNDCFTIYK